MLAWLISPIAIAHTADTSYARVILHDDRIETRLTFDAFSLQKIVPALDADGDLALSKAELRAATPAIQQFLRDRVGIEVNEAATDLGAAGDPFWPLDAPDPLPAKLWHANESLISFPFDKPASAPTKSVALLFAVFDTLSPQHQVLGVFEHAGQPHPVIFTASEPDYLFDTAYASATPLAHTDERRGNANASPVREFLWQGALHIWEGYDHLCFLLALLVASRPRQLIGIITSFTIAHSITLTLAAMKVVSLPGRIVESAIAASIIYVAVGNLVQREPRHRIFVTFVLGLIHGFGFANVLGELELPSDAFVQCMFIFNVGVELGQLAVVAALLPVGWLVVKMNRARQVRAVVSVAAGLFGLAWLIDRVFALERMPF